MLLISHRGNIDRIIQERENSPEYIDEAISQGYDVEMDIWLVDDNLFLGHDNGNYPIGLQWLLERKNSLWIHAKNFEVLSFLIKQNLRIFYHQKENHTIINNCNLIWSHELSEANSTSIIPLLNMEDINKWVPRKVYAICSDYVAILKEKHNAI